LAASSAAANSVVSQGGRRVSASNTSCPDGR
jgi:hypothetical protein